MTSPAPNTVIPRQFKYQQVETSIRRLAQTLPIGSLLPSERSMAVSYGYNFLTVRRALKELVHEGLIVRRIGSGTYVARHAAAKAPLSPSSRRIGLLVCQNGDSYSYRVLRALHQVDLAQGVELRSRWVEKFTEDGLSQAQFLLHEGCTAIILPWFPADHIEEVLAFVQKCPLPVSLPVVIPGLENNCFEQPRIFSDGLAAATIGLCDYFYELGFRRVALLGPDSTANGILQQKLGAYVCHVSRRHEPALCGLVRPGAEAMDALATRWKTYHGDLAVISYDDEHALRFITAMHKIGLSAPDDFQIIGHNNDEAGNYSDPPLSTLVQNFDYLAHRLLKSALALAEGWVDQSTCLPRPQIMVRGTCGGAGRIDDTFRARLRGLDLVTPRIETPTHATVGTVPPCGAVGSVVAKTIGPGNVTA